MRILCIGDVVGKAGSEFLRQRLPSLKKLKKIDETIEKLKAKYDEAQETVEQKGDNAKASQLQKLASAKQKLDDALENKKQLQKEEKELIEKKKALGLRQTL